MNLDQLKQLATALTAVLTPIIGVIVAMKLLTPDQADALNKQLPVLIGGVGSIAGSIIVVWKVLHGQQVDSQNKVNMAMALANVGVEQHDKLLKVAGMKSN